MPNEKQREVLKCLIDINPSMENWMTKVAYSMWVQATQILNNCGPPVRTP